MLQLSSTSYELGPFDQLPALSTYTVITLGFPLLHERAVIEKHLQTATTKLIHAVPWLAGKIALHIPDGEEKTCSGTYSITTDTQHSILTFADLSSDLPTYQDLTTANAPISKLPGSKLTTAKALPALHDPSKQTCPVFLLQASFIHSGLLLTFATQHNASDMNGQGQLIRLFAQALRSDTISDEPFTPSQLHWANVDRRSVVPGVRDDERAPDFAHLRCESKIGKDPYAGAEAADACWKVMRFPAAGLRELKERASGTGDGGMGMGWVSTNDALTAFVWQCVTRARAPRLEGGEEEVRLLRAVNGRGRLVPKVSEEYVGHLVGAVVEKVSVGYVVDPENLAAIASRLRQSVYAVDDLHIRALVSLFAGLKDKTTVDFAKSMKFSRDLVISSWGELRLSEQEFGILGKPDWCRRPDFAPFESCTYVCEKSRDGDYYVQGSYRVEDWENLEADELFKKYAVIVG